MQKKPKSLIMCVTPFQMLIAEKIIESREAESFDLIVMAYSDNKKYRHYYNRLRQKCARSIYYTEHQGIIGFLHFKAVLIKNGFSRRYRNLYLASIDSRHLQYLVSDNKSSNIYTFDDGSANIFKDGVYYSSQKPAFPKRLIWRALGVKLYIENIRQASKLHFTIYPNLPNITSTLEFVELFNDWDEDINIHTFEHQKTVNIFLGQPLTDISKHYTIEYLEKALKPLNIDYYYPHPREHLIPSGNFTLLESKLIFEDYIINLLKNNPKLRVHIYSFTSSCLLNLKNFRKIETTYLYDSYLINKLSTFYQVAEDRFNINVQKI